MDSRNIVAMYQVGSLLCSRYGFKEQVFREYTQFLKTEMWLLNTKDPNFQLIRVTTRTSDLFNEDRERLQTIIETLSYICKREIYFLDIHIDDQPYLVKNEEYPYLNLFYDGFADGKDVHDFYPDLYHCIQNYEDEKKELSRQVVLLNKADKNKKNKNAFLKNNGCYITYVLMFICILNYLLSYFLKRNYANAAVFVVLGADYKTFTLGLGQYYRLITSAFVHGSFLHLFSNMYSLLLLGTYLEKRLGKWNYLFALFVSLLTSSLSQAILTENTITIGISGAVYGLVVIFALDLLKLRLLSVRSFLPLIIINVMINFLDTTAWIAHLGGLIAGVVLYYYFFTEDKTGLLVLILGMLLSLLYRYVTIKEISPLYGATDMEIIRIYSDFGLKDYAYSLMKRLAQVYKQFGGIS